MKYLFTDNFPLITTETELQTLIKKYSNYDSYYVTSGSIKERKNKFDSLYQKYYQYADSNFLKEIKKKVSSKNMGNVSWLCIIGKRNYFFI